MKTLFLSVVFFASSLFFVPSATPGAKPESGGILHVPSTYDPFDLDDPLDLPTKPQTQTVKPHVQTQASTPQKPTIPDFKKVNSDADLLQMINNYLSALAVATPSAKLDGPLRDMRRSGAIGSLGVKLPLLIEDCLSKNRFIVYRAVIKIAVARSEDLEKATMALHKNNWTSEQRTSYHNLFAALFRSLEEGLQPKIDAQKIVSSSEFNRMFDVTAAASYGDDIVLESDDDDDDDILGNNTPPKHGPSGAAIAQDMATLAWIIAGAAGAIINALLK